MASIVPSGLNTLRKIHILLRRSLSTNNSSFLVPETPRPELPGFGTPFGTPLTVNYSEGAEVGYRWFAQQDEKPLFAFGHGLSYTSFAFEDLQVSGGETITASFTVTNTGKRKGIDVPQLYLTDAAGDKRVRLLGFERLELEPGEARRVSVEADPRLLARFDTAANQWHIKAGEYRVALGESAQSLLLRATTRLVEQQFAD
jgi:beta-glucosidase